MSRTFDVVLMFVVAALSVFAERAAAQIPAVNGVLYACVRIDPDGDEGREMRFVAADSRCHRNETKIHWSVTGPPGDAGATGATGPAGLSTVVVGSADALVCPAGGALLATLDSAGNQIPGRTRSICNGKDGKDATRAAGPCFDNRNLYVSCGNGTVTDSVTGLIWLKQVDCLPNADWAAANMAAAGLKAGDCGLTDGSSPGDWRLPTIDEWSAQALRLGCTFAGPGTAPSVTNDEGTGCYGDGSASSFAGMPIGEDLRLSGSYWSSTNRNRQNNPFSAWYVSLYLGAVDSSSDSSDNINTKRVWPVRGGRR